MRNELIISNSTDLLRVMPSDIMCVMADGNYSKVIMSDSDTQVVTYQLGQVALMISDQLGTDGQVFIRIGRGVIINISYLYTISLPKQQLQLRSPYGQVRTLTVPREALKQLKNYIDERLKKNKDNGED